MKRSGIGFLLVTKRVLAVFLVLSGTAGAVDSATHRCPSPNPFAQKDDPDHYYSAPSRNGADKAPNQCNSCKDPANSGDKSCSVYEFLHSDHCKGLSSCSNRYAFFNIYRKSGQRAALAHMFSASKPCHFVLFALDPVIGVEDANHRGYPNFWNHAYSASQRLISPAVAPEELGLAINPATRRGQHQLHIHIGKLPRTYRQAIDQLGKHQDFRSVQINEVDYRVAYVPDPTGPFSALSPFEVVSNAYGERFMPREGMLVARSKDGNGWFVLAALDKFVEGQLDYTTRQCSMAPPP